jgi:hypothetical protein
MCLRVLCGIAQNGTSESARVSAVGLLLERGWGKAPTTHTGADGEGDIRVVVRHIINGRDAPMKTIEASPNLDSSDAPL